MSKHLTDAVLQRQQRDHDAQLPTMRTACLAMGYKALVAHYSGRADDLSLDSIMAIPFTAYPEDNIDVPDLSEFEIEQPQDRYHYTMWKTLRETVNNRNDHSSECHISGQLVFDLQSGKIDAQDHLSDPWESDDLPF